MSKALLLLAVGAIPLGAQELPTHEVRLAVEKEDAKKLKPGALKSLEAVLKKRLSIVSVEEGTVEVAGPEEIRIRVPAQEITESQLKMLTRPGVLEVRSLESVKTTLNGDGRYLLDFLQVQEQSRIRFRDVRSGERLTPEEFLPRCPLLLGNADLEPGTAARIGSGATLSVRVQFTDRGAKRLRGYTNKPGRLLAIALDGELVGLHAVARKVGKPPKGEKGELGVMDIGSGFGAEEEAGYLALVLNSGPLPARLRVASQGPLTEQP